MIRENLKRLSGILKNKSEKELTFDNLLYYLQAFYTLNKNAALLEVGVGDQGFANLYKNKVGRYIGLDVMDYSKYYEDIDFIVYDGLEIPIKNNSVDVVVSHSVLEHVSDIAKVMAEINRVLKVRGVAYLTINPLYFSSWGSHLTLDDCTTKVDNWQHIDPSFEHYLTDDPMALRYSATISRSAQKTKCHSVNKLTVSEFLKQVGLLPWPIIRFDRYLEGKPIPDFLKASEFLYIDLIVNEFRFIGQKLCDIPLYK